MGDEGLMRKLEENRKWGRDDYPIRPVWNSVLAGLSISIQVWTRCGGNFRAMGNCGINAGLIAEGFSRCAAVMGVYAVFEAFI